MSHLQSILNYAQRTDDGLIVTEADLRVLVNDAFDRGARAACEADCKAMCEFCALETPAEWHEADATYVSGWVHNRRTGRTWCNAGGIRNTPLPEMEDK